MQQHFAMNCKERMSVPILPEPPALRAGVGLSWGRQTAVILGSYEGALNSELDGVSHLGNGKHARARPRRAKLQLTSREADGRLDGSQIEVRNGSSSTFDRFFDDTEGSVQPGRPAVRPSVAANVAYTIVPGFTITAEEEQFRCDRRHRPFPAFVLIERPAAQGCGPGSV